MKKGFTLVELLVVITILLILGSIAFISVEDYSHQDKKDECILNNFDNIKKDIAECSEAFAPYRCEEIIMKKYKCDTESLKNKK